MNSVSRCIFVCVVVASPLYSAWAEDTVVEDASEFERLDVIFSTKTTGIIEAYKCRSCPAKVFYFDGQLVVDSVTGASLFQKLGYVDGKPGALTWSPGTTKALRVLVPRNGGG